MNKTAELYPKLVNAAEMEWREFRQSGHRMKKSRRLLTSG